MGLNVRRLVLVMCLMPVVWAHDEHFSAFLVSSPLNILNPGFGVELAGTLGQRTVFAAGMDITEPGVESQRAYRIRLDSRLIYSSELNTQWYPTASVQWQLPDNRLTAWLGVGFQRNLLEPVSLVAETQWQPGSADVQLRIGLRFWLMRFQSLDARVKAADPQGAVYVPGNRPPTSVVNQSVVLESSPLAATEDSRSGVTASLSPGLDLSAKDTVTVTHDAPSSAMMEKPSAVATALKTSPQMLVPGWYLHLGLFNLEKSVQEMSSDLRLRDYQSHLVTWYDASKQGYRVLLGPWSRVSAQEYSSRLKSQGLDNFLYSADTP